MFHDLFFYIKELVNIFTQAKMLQFQSFQTKQVTIILPVLSISDCYNKKMLLQIKLNLV